MEYQVVKYDFFDWICMNDVPLGNIYLATQTMRLVDPENYDEYIELIQRNSDFIHRSFQDFIYISRARRKDAKVRVQPIQLESFFKQILKKIETFIPVKDVEISFQNKSVRKEIRTDGERLEQIVLKLITNGILHNLSEQKKITITVEDTEEDIIFSFTDNGVGIPEEYFDKIFEPFIILQYTTFPPDNHVGLGLTVIREFLQLMKGSCKIESTVGEGSTFRIQLPAGIRVYSKRLAQESLYEGINDRTVELEMASFQ